MKNRIFLLLVTGVVLASWQPVAASAAQAQARFRTCSGFDGPFQVPASQKCPLSGYAHFDQPTEVDIKGRPKAAPAPRASNFRTCSGFDGPYQVPVSQKCPLSGYAHSDEPTKTDIKGRPQAAAQAQAPRNPKFRTCNGTTGTFQIPVSRKCPLSGYAND
ncbi:hypothetical protein RFM99_18775 [Mesorhizobium sp. VK4C]|uniref:hypothetical protein n=1 Tax=Mesorhizobium captivum TaxID=3072319 RepID=UPI002A2431B7|nr:hypothetical protein [Mesorhizobium sp. VK4C]MDX8500455.1 hypothetical protein [Mesorhizobium sp. VK4C]